jgi:hypothetical protein
MIFEMAWNPHIVIHGAVETFFGKSWKWGIVLFHKVQ